MEIRDWQRPRPTSVAWLFVFAITPPAAHLVLSLLNGQIARSGLAHLASPLTTLGVIAGVIFFFLSYCTREKHAWTALESKLRGEAFISEQLREEMGALRARIETDEEEIGALHARMEELAEIAGIVSQTTRAGRKSEW